MRKPVQRLSAYFAISEKEANGFIILSGIMLLMVVCPYWYRIIYQSYKEKESQLIIVPADISPDYSDNVFLSFPFDPNNASTEDLHSLGFSASLVQRIEKYRDAGGKFKIKSDLKKIYGFPDETYDKFYDCIQLPDSVVVKQKVPLKEDLYVKKTDINKATAPELQNVKGIGPVLSGRIVKYRELLGGFVSVDQLKEVYGMPIETLDKIRSQLFVAQDFIPKQISLSNNPYHPYLASGQRKYLSTLRKMHPDLSGEALLDSCRFSAEDYKKISPYLQSD